MDLQEEYLKLLFGCELELRAFIGSIVRGSHDCDDLFQEIALTLWKEFARYDRSRPFGAWARGIAAVKLMQRWDQSKRLPVVLSPEAIQSVCNAFDQSEVPASRRAEALEHCLDQLPEKSRRLLALRYERSLTIEQIAQELQATLDAVYQSLSRLRARLQDCINRRLSAPGAR
ncbi:MAG: sigma-70 family RNA polymerase sigma factor [Planctomycetaceae bacterium]|nr:sigma-70 family RNA polymerase sigma factor [Planctomycetaceae bacterium]